MCVTSKSDLSSSAEQNHFDISIDEIPTEGTFHPSMVVVTAVFLGVIVAGFSVLDIYLLKRCFGEEQNQLEDTEPYAQVFPVTIPYFSER